MQNHFIKLSSAIAIGGLIRPAGSTVEVSDELAKNLIHRGKGVLATDETDHHADLAEKAADVDLSKLNKTQLLEVAAAAGLTDVTDENTKAQIIAAIEAAAVE